jgi:hypothetical protein
MCKGEPFATVFRRFLMPYFSERFGFYQHYSLLMGAALVRMVRRDAEQVRLVERYGTKYIIHDVFGLNILSLDPTFSYIGWCAMECCSSNEETCYEYDDGYSKPFTKQYCKAVRLIKSIFLFPRNTHRTRCKNLSCRDSNTIDCRRRLPLPKRSGKVWSG